MSEEAWVAGIAASLVGLMISALAAAADTAFDEANRARLRRLAADDGRSAGVVRRLVADPRRAWVTSMVLGSVGLALAVAGVALAASGAAWRPGTFVLALAAFGGLAVVLAQLVPRAWATRHPEAAATATAPLIGLAAWVVDPLFGPAARWLGVYPPEQIRTIREQELRMLLDVDTGDGPIEHDEMQMITGIIELGETKVHEIMVPRIDIVAIPTTTTLDEALDTIIEAGHSRIPVYWETIDDIAGLLYAKDLLKAFRDRDFEAKISSYLREPHFVPESKAVDALLADLQARRVHMAIVVDEYGGTAGLVTIEDLLEEIVGDIRDEYDIEEEPQVVHVSRDEAICDAGMNIYDVSRMMDINLPAEDVNTLAGLVFSRLGRVPTPGERVVFDDAEIEVMAVEGRRVHRVRVLRRQPAGAAGDAAEPAPATTRPANG